MTLSPRGGGAKAFVVGPLVDDIFFAAYKVSDMVVLSNGCAAPFKNFNFSNINK